MGSPLGSWLAARMADLTLDPETPLAGVCCLPALPNVEFVDTAMVFVTFVFVGSPVLADIPTQTLAQSEMHSTRAVCLVVVPIEVPPPSHI